MTKELLEQSIVHSVAKHGIPIRYFSSPAYKLAVGQLASSVGLSLHRDNVRKFVISAADNLKAELKKDLEGKLVYVKVDCATRIRTSYMGVNIRLVDKNNTAVTHTLVVKDTNAEHSSFALRKLISSVLEDFGIPLQNVLCCISDNASNMVRLVKDINLDLEKIRRERQMDDDDHDSDAFPFSDDEDDSQDGEEQETQESEPDHSQSYRGDEEEQSLTAPEAETADAYIQAEEELFRKMENSLLVEHVRCGVHTLQLAILDGLRIPQAGTIVANARKLAVEARKPKVSAELKKAKKLAVILDQETRWSSTYMMLDRIVQLKSILVELGNRNVIKGPMLFSSQWKQLEELRDLLHKPAVVTSQLQVGLL